MHEEQFDKTKLYEAIEMIANGAKFSDENVKGRLHIILDKSANEEEFINGINEYAIEMAKSDENGGALGAYLHGVFVGIWTTYDYAGRVIGLNGNTKGE